MSVNLNYWLRKTPRPVAVMADSQRIEVPRNGRAWRDLTATIQSLEPSKLTCLDGQGNVIRSIDLDTDDDKPAASASPEMTDLQLFAKLLAEAWDKAGSRMQPIVDSAMAFVERGGTRLAKAEAENDRLRAHVHKLNLQLAEITGEAGAEGGGDSSDSIMGTMLAGVLQGAAAASKPVVPIKTKTTNGAKT